MKLGPFWRKRFTSLYVISRKLSSLISYCFWFFLDPSKFKIIKTSKIKKILIVLLNTETGNIGGDFCTLGVLNYFNQVYPNVKLSILSDKETINRFGKIPNIEMIIYENKNTLEKIRQKKFDALLGLNFLHLTSKDFKFIPYRIGLPSTKIQKLLKIKGQFFFTRKIFFIWGKHEVDRRFKMFESLGFKFKQKKLKLVYSKKEEETIISFLKKNKIKKFIIIHPGGKHMVDTLKRGKWPPHLWPLERYSKVADYFIKKGFKVLITGSKQEKFLVKKINTNLKKKAIDCCGKFTIREIGALVSKANALIATDTSIVHIAYQTPVPIVELMSPTPPSIVGAWPLDDPKHKILFDDGPCARSMRKIECPEDIICMNNISVNQVIQSTEEVMKN